MQHQTARACARIGAVMLLASMLFPWFGHDIGPIHVDYKVWSENRTMAIALGVFALVAVTQIQFASPGVIGRVWLLLGGGLAAYLAFRVFTPPQDPVTELLDAMNLQLHARIGVYIALAGSVMIGYGGWLQVKSDLMRAGPGEPPAVRDHAPPPARDPFASRPAPGMPASGQTIQPPTTPPPFD